jgi:hypothetical protein
MLVSELCDSDVKGGVSEPLSRKEVGRPRGWKEGRDVTGRTALIL